MPPGSVESRRRSRGPWGGLVLASALVAGCEPPRPPAPQISWTGRPPAASDSLGDPRDDPHALAQARATIASASDWSEGYARLVRREATGAVPSASPEATAVPALPRASDPLLADLIGSTIVDFWDEIGRIERGYGGSPPPARLAAFRVQAPPWPPESVAHLIRGKIRRGEDPGPWVEALANQIAPDRDANRWLLASWGRPRRPIDGALLDEIARADRGRLAREPRFRAWLRAEWRAWAFQKFRLVARASTGGAR